MSHTPSATRRFWRAAAGLAVVTLPFTMAVSCDPGYDEDRQEQQQDREEDDQEEDD